MHIHCYWISETNITHNFFNIYNFSLSFISYQNLLVTSHFFLLYFIFFFFWNKQCWQENQIQYYVVWKWMLYFIKRIKIYSNEANVNLIQKYSALLAIIKSSLETYFNPCRMNAGSWIWKLNKISVSSYWNMVVFFIY